MLVVLTSNGRTTFVQSLQTLRSPTTRNPGTSSIITGISTMVSSRSKMIPWLWKLTCVSVQLVRELKNI